MQAFQLSPAFRVGITKPTRRSTARTAATSLVSLALADYLRVIGQRLTERRGSSKIRVQFRIDHFRLRPSLGPLQSNSIFIRPSYMLRDNSQPTRKPPGWRPHRGCAAEMRQSPQLRPIPYHENIRRTQRCRSAWEDQGIVFFPVNSECRQLYYQASQLADRKTAQRKFGQMDCRFNPPQPFSAHATRVRRRAFP